MKREGEEGGEEERRRGGEKSGGQDEEEVVVDCAMPVLHTHCSRSPELSSNHGCFSLGQGRGRGGGGRERGKRQRKKSASVPSISRSILSLFLCLVYSVHTVSSCSWVNSSSEHTVVLTHSQLNV